MDTGCFYSHISFMKESLYTGKELIGRSTFFAIEQFGRGNSLEKSIRQQYQERLTCICAIYIADKAWMLEFTCRTKSGLKTA